MASLQKAIAITMMTKGSNKHKLAHVPKGKLRGRVQLSTSVTRDPEATVKCNSMLCDPTS